MTGRAVMRWVSLLAALAVVLLIGNALRLRSHQIEVPAAEPLPLDADAAARRLAAVLRLATISDADPAADRSAFHALHAQLADDFPRTHAALTREVVGGASLLYTWQGRDGTLPAILLLAHQDVVPVDPATTADWRYDAFSGAIAEHEIWGRGALDDKAPLVAMLEAVERCLIEGWRPERTVYLAFGHDEEVGGALGAVAIARLLGARGVRIEYILDEGLAIVDGVLPVNRPVALVGVAEKGVANIELWIERPGGHASMPPDDSAVRLLAGALDALARDPLPASLDGPAAALFDHLAPEMGFAARIVFANRWLFGPLLKRRLTSVPATNALVRTTMVPTRISAGVRDNVLPARATATLHVRLRPGDTIAGVVAAVRERIRDERVRVEPLPGGSEPAHVSAFDTPAFGTVARVIRETFPDALVAPALVVAATDARHYAGLTPHVFRFAPVRLSDVETSRIHGVGERIPLSEYLDAIRFYHRLLRASAAMAPETPPAQP
jgi:carboxypeptidase PM20D1